MVFGRVLIGDYADQIATAAKYQGLAEKAPSVSNLYRLASGRWFRIHYRLRARRRGKLVNIGDRFDPVLIAVIRGSGAAYASGYIFVCRTIHISPELAGIVSARGSRLEPARGRCRQESSRIGRPSAAGKYQKQKNEAQVSAARQANRGAEEGPARSAGLNCHRVSLSPKIVPRHESFLAFVRLIVQVGGSAGVLSYAY